MTLVDLFLLMAYSGFSKAVAAVWMAIGIALGFVVGRLTRRAR